MKGLFSGVRKKMPGSIRTKEVGARPDGRLFKWSSMGQGLTPQVVSTSYLVLGHVPYALARSTYHRVTKGQQGQGPLL